MHIDVAFYSDEFNSTSMFGFTVHGKGSWWVRVFLEGLGRARGIPPRVRKGQGYSSGTIVSGRT